MESTVKTFTSSNVFFGSRAIPMSSVFQAKISAFSSAWLAARLNKTERCAVHRWHMQKSKVACTGIVELFC